MVFILTLLPAAALGVINLKQTPVQMVEESKSILHGTVGTSISSGEWRFTVAGALKGQGGRPVAISLAECKREDAETIRRLLVRENRAEWILFVTKEGMPDFLHVAGTWLQLNPAGEVRWRVVGLASRRVSSVYFGGTDMLIRMCRHIISDPRARVPVSVGTAWKGVARVGRIAGEITGMEALRWNGEVYLFVASSAGDRLLRAKKLNKNFEDMTARARLDTGSRQFAWMDLGGGKPCLASWDGKVIRLRVLEEDGTFRPPGESRDHSRDEECLGLSPCRLPGGKGLVLVASGPNLPVLLRWNGSGWDKTELPSGSAGRSTTTGAAACIVADLDGDGFWDVLQPREKGGLFWRGGKDGFSDPMRSALASSGRPGCSTLGDFNQDGHLDVFLSGPEHSRLWENNGAGDFTEVIQKSGSLARHAAAGLSACHTADLNHDGRLDLCLLHARDRFTYHFNRGFRCFGEEGGLKLRDPAGEETSTGGQAACAVEDFNGDGSLDLAVAFTDGQISCYFNKASSKSMLPVGLESGAPGPVTASIWRGKKNPHCLGALPVPVPPGKIYFGVGRPGEYTLRYHLPGAPDRARQVKVFPRRGGGPGVILGE